MTTNSYGSPLPIFDFPQTVAKATRSAPRRLPLSARGLPIVASVGFLAYYIGSQAASLRGPASAASAMRAEAGLAAARLRALEDAYGDRSSLANLEAAARAYDSAAGPAPARPPTEATARFRGSLPRAREHESH